MLLCRMMCSFCVGPAGHFSLGWKAGLCKISAILLSLMERGVVCSFS